jgi:hypothetical protein
VSRRTLYLSRLIGLFTLIVAVAMLVDKSQAMDTLQAVVRDRSAVIVIGMLGTAAGLAMVLGHQIWSGGVLPVVVTLLGWIILIRGTILLFLPLHTTAQLVERLRFDQFFYRYLGLAVALGFYLTVHGFVATGAKRRV